MPTRDRTARQHGRSIAATLPYLPEMLRVANRRPTSLVIRLPWLNHPFNLDLDPEHDPLIERLSATLDDVLIALSNEARVVPPLHWEGSSPEELSKRDPMWLAAFALICAAFDDVLRTLSANAAGRALARCRKCHGWFVAEHDATVYCQLGSCLPRSPRPRSAKRL